MKNRILCRLVSIGTAVLTAGTVAGTAVCHGGTAVYGASLENGNSGLAMVQRAYWTEEEAFDGELEIEITGLKEWLNAYRKNREESLPGELPEEITATPIPTPFETPSEAPSEVPSEKTSETPLEKETGEMEDEENPLLSDEQKTEPEESRSGAEEDSGSAGDLEGDPFTGLENYSEENSSQEYSDEIEIITESLTAGGEKRPQLSGGSAVRCVGIRTAGEMGTETDTAESPQVMLVTRISRYFQADTEKLPEECTIQEMMFPGQEGELESAAEIVYPIDMEETADNIPFIVKIPFVLREEYRYNENNRLFPVNLISPSSEAGTAQETAGTAQEADGTSKAAADTGLSSHDNKELSGAGTFLLIENKGERQILAKAEQAVVLEASAAPADYTITVATDTETPKAGQTLTYHITVTNTGKQPLPLISLESAMSPAGLTGSWQSGNPGGSEQETDISGQKAILTKLTTGESRQLDFQVKLPESLNGPVINTVTAKAQKTTGSGNVVVRGASLKITVTPLKADFTVNKSADRTSAAPGDTITYQICIRNTGERTLHSVLSTERFQSENISARFTEKEGVVLNSTKTQALISQIPPGEVFSLEAVVTLPETLNSRELINQVFVRTKETGDKTVQSASGVKILGISPTPAPAKEPDDPYSGNDLSDSGSSPVSEYPKTSDDTELAFWLCMLGLAFLAGVGAYGYYSFRRRQ
ncbi:MAG: hypothetical protein Q4C77_06170 [Eubacteriales bacterium]|nr:hypothetical protein [Eubacteriales bacterium]